MIHATYCPLREINCSWTSREFRMMPANFWMNIYKNPDISQSLYLISAFIWQYSQVHPMFSLALLHVPRLIILTPMVLHLQSSDIAATTIPGVYDSSHSEGLPDCPASVTYSPEVDTSQFTLHILSYPPGGSQWLKYIVLMYWRCVCNCYP